LKLLSSRFEEPTRRGLVTGLAGALLGVRLLPALSGQTASTAADEPLAGTPPHPVAAGGTAKRVIYLYMDGGMSHLDTLDPKAGDVAGPTRSIATSVPGVELAEYLPRTARRMHQGALVRSLSSTQGAHEQGNYFMHTSFELRGTIAHPSLGAWLGHFNGPGNPMLPASVYIGNASRHPGAGFLPPEFSPLFVNNPENGLRAATLPAGLTVDRRAARLALARGLDESFVGAFGSQRNVAAHTDAYDAAVRMMSSRDVVAFDLAAEPAAVRDAYGREPFGQGCLLARRLAERGVGFVEVSLHGWDTHSSNFTATPDLCRQLDAGLSALLADLDDRGLLAETLVVLTTEFGRSPKINPALGRDHYPQAFSAALFGGGVKGGAVHGATTATGEEVADAMVTIPDFNATIGHALGLPLDRVVFSPSRRPFMLADKGKPITGLFG